MSSATRFPCYTGRVANLTLTIDDDLLRRARIRALERGTSVNALVREYVESFAGEGEAERGLREFLQTALSSPAGSGKGGRKWQRDDVYESHIDRHG
jgi:hypothetical protein